MTDDDVIIFEKFKLKKNPKSNKCKNNFEDPLFWKFFGPGAVRSENSIGIITIMAVISDLNESEWPFYYQYDLQFTTKMTVSSWNFHDQIDRYDLNNRHQNDCYKMIIFIEFIDNDHLPIITVLDFTWILVSGPTWRGPIISIFWSWCSYWCTAVRC